MRMASGLAVGLSPWQGLPGVTEVRVLGEIGVVEMARPVVMRDIQRRFVDRGVWVRPFGRLVYLMPPYIISDQELEWLCAVTVDIISKNSG